MVREPQVILTHRENQRRAKLVPGKVLEAVEVLELELPVRVRWANGRTRRGSARFRDGQHCITLSTYLTAKQVTKTLWHELCHCAQRERADCPPEEWYHHYMRATPFRGYAGYLENPYEVEARELADLMEDEELAR